MLPEIFLWVSILSMELPFWSYYLNQRKKEKHIIVYARYSPLIELLEGFCYLGLVHYQKVVFLYAAKLEITTGQEVSCKKKGSTFFYRWYFFFCFCFLWTYTKLVIACFEFSRRVKNQVYWSSKEKRNVKLVIQGERCRENQNRFSMLLDDEELELRELQAGQNPPTCSAHFASNPVHGCSFCKG